MRIVSGILKGRTFSVPSAGMRPTRQDVREAVFSSLADRVSGARVLDLFAGSGGYSLEAWSRGAAEVIAVENAAAAYRMLEENIRALEGDPQLGTCRAVRAGVYEFLRRKTGRFDLIFSDPPYDQADVPKLLSEADGALSSGGLLVFELRASGPFSVPSEWTPLKEKKYGGTRILYLQKQS